MQMQRVKGWELYGMTTPMDRFNERITFLTLAAAAKAYAAYGGMLRPCYIYKDATK